MASCANEQGANDKAGPELVHMEGEFRISSGAPQFMNCDDYKNFRAVSPGMKSIELSYNNFIAIPGDPIKMWISGYLDAQDVSGSGLLDSVVVIEKVLEMNANDRCPTRPLTKGVGRYRTVLDTSNAFTRTIELDLYDSGLAIMYTYMHEGMIPAEESGEWGINSNGDVLITWTRREQDMLFSLSNEYLASKMFHPDGKKLVLKLQGPPIFPAGRMLEVIDMMKTLAAPYHDTTGMEIVYSTTINSLIPDSLGMQPVYDILGERYEVSKEKMRSRSMYFENAEDVLQFIRYAARVKK